MPIKISQKEIVQLEHLANILRGFIFASVEAAKSGHPGGSSSKVEQLLALLFVNGLAFDPADPKHSGRNRIIWSAGHCTPLLFAANALIYECMRRDGRQFSQVVTKCVMPEDLLRFRQIDGPQGHAESIYPLSDYGTGLSGHGFSAAGGMAIAHQSCGLPTKVWVFMGDAESEEGISYEARNVLKSTGAKNLIVSLDYNHFGIDGPIEEVIGTKYAEHWKVFGWNVFECDGHDISDVANAYDKAQKIKNSSPTVVICHTTKGKSYGKKENSENSHGSPADTQEFEKIMNTLGFNVKENNTNPALWIDAILSKITRDDEKYVCAKMEKNAEQIQKESDLIQKIRTSLRGRPIFNPLNIRRPRKLPDELTFSDGEKIATRKAAQQFFKWLMKQTAFCWIGAGDVSKSVLTDEAEKEYGIISPKNPLGRGIRFGIAEQNMAMMSLGMTHDILPGDFKPFSVFGTFAEFTPMIGNCVRLALINNGANPDKKSFFVAIASHDGPETGEDGPTHQGLYWMSYFDALPGIKVYKPLDAQETIEMLFYAIEKGEPIALSLSREALPLFDRQKYGASNPKDACNGAYIFKPFENNLKKKMVLVVSGGFAMKNTLDALPAISEKYNTKIVAVTSPKLFEELRKENPNDAEEIFSYDEIKITRTIHNGWKGFLNNFLLPENYEQKSVGVECYLKSGTPKDLYELAGLDSKSIIQKILSV